MSHHGRPRIQGFMMIYGYLWMFNEMWSFSITSPNRMTSWSRLSRLWESGVKSDWDRLRWLMRSTFRHLKAFGWRMRRAACTMASMAMVSVAAKWKKCFRGHPVQVVAILRQLEKNGGFFFGWFWMRTDMAMECWGSSRDFKRGSYFTRCSWHGLREGKHGRTQNEKWLPNPCWLRITMGFTNHYILVWLSLSSP